MFNAWKLAHEQSKMIGWDFSVLEGRLHADEPWWDFEEDCRSALSSAHMVADLGTGGGERLRALLNKVDWSGKQVTATEGWDTNIPVAREALAAWDVKVHRYESERDQRMPFADNSLDLIMSRHESFDVAEASRILSPGGRLLTQQVDGHDAEEIHEWFGEPYEYPQVSSQQYVEAFEAAGLRVDVVDDWRGTMKFKDATALVTYLALVPWDAPGFSVDEQKEKLAVLDADRPIQVTQRRFRIYGTKI